MTKGIKAVLVVVSVGILVYLVSLASVSVADDGNAEAEEEFADVTISLEACVVRVPIEVLQEGAGDSDFLALSSISADDILNRVGTEEAEVVSGVKLLVGNGALAEITTEDSLREEEKDQEHGSGEHADRETSVSFRAKARLSTGGNITAEISFKHTLSENTSSESGEGEREEEAIHVFEVSSMVGLQVRRPLVAGARKSGDEAMFLILYADI